MCGRLAFKEPLPTNQQINTEYIICNICEVTLNTGLLHLNNKTLKTVTSLPGDILNHEATAKTANK